MDLVPHIDIDILSMWLCLKHKDGRVDGVITNIIIHLLMSPLGCSVLLQDNVQRGLNQMMRTNDTHLGYDTLTEAIRLLPASDVHAKKHLEILTAEHSCLVDPTFPSTDSMLWCYRELPASLRPRI